jgi:hypothetical protein
MNATLKMIKDRCTEDGECWLWTGAKDDRGRPTMHYKRKTVAVRRVVRMLTDRKDIPAGMQVPCSCGNTGCVSPVCSTVATPKERAQMAASRGVFNRPDAILKSVMTTRARSHITDDKVERIRSAEGPAWKVAEAEGISVSYAKEIRANRSRKDYRNPFTGLGAR